MNRIVRAAQSFFSDLRVIVLAVAQATVRGQGKQYCKALAKLSKQALHQVRTGLVNDTTFGSSITSEALQRLRNRAQQLHPLLPEAAKFQYSILIPVFRPTPRFFETALRSALEQSAPHCEVLLGYDGQQPPEVEAVVSKLMSENFSWSTRVRVIHCDRTETGGGISRTTNCLAAEAKGNYLLLMDHDDWIRPDLLYRYELALRLSTTPENTVLYCNEFKIDEHDRTIPDSFFSKPEHPGFPYLFINYVCHCLLIPKSLWLRVGGERPECDGAQDYDLTLRLDAAGAQFQNVPLFLYAWRSHIGSTAQSLGTKDYATDAGVRAMTDYAAQKKLPWKVSAGLARTTYRACPDLTKKPHVHAVTLFKDQKDLTLRCIDSLQKQTGVNLSITAVDNNSSDGSIAAALIQRGVEVITIPEGFNFSRLNNAAVQRSRFSQTKHFGSDSLLFINNDVELEHTAVEEMCRWIEQPRVGVVGCRLHYPDGNIQHGGVDLHHLSPAHEMVWYHVDIGTPLELAGFSKVIRVCPAVTAACCLVLRSTFLSVGGFDEQWYPVAYSDTNFCVKIQQRGLYCLYTPYAVGTHHEGASRGVGSIEDFEKSRWLHTKVLQHNAELNEPATEKDWKIFGSY